jgi:hypothetical protein
MFYRLLGMVVWKGAKLYLKRRYSGGPPARLLVALAGLAVVGVGAAVLASRNGHPSE